MRIGILTFHRANNYGAQLQCYALCQALIKRGHDAEAIDYRQPEIEKNYCGVSAKDFNPLHPMRFIKSLFLPQTLTRNIRHNKFAKFRNKYIPCSKKTYTPESRNIEEYDLVLIGSDQLWNSKWTKGWDSFYWGEFIHPERTSVASYAVSIGKTTITDDERINIKKRLNNFDFLSVRENSLKKIVKGLTDKDIKVVVDPTFLLGKTDWLRFVKPSGKRYVLIYPLLFAEETIEIGRKIAKEHNIDYVIIDSQSHWKPMKRHRQFADPAEFLNLIANAEYVVTSSFHGTAFSVIYEKQFFSVVSKDSVNTRIASLLASLNLENRIVNEETVISAIPPIEYAIVKRDKKRLVDDSVNFITEVLDEVSLTK